MSQTKAQLIDNLVQALNFTGTASAPANGLFLSATNTLQLSTASTPRLTINSDGHVDVVGNLDVGAGIDVTGNITATGAVDAVGITIGGNTPSLSFNDANDDPDFRFLVNSNSFILEDTTNSANRLVVNSDGHVDITGNLDVGAGIDVTGSSTMDGTVTINANSTTPALHLQGTGPQIIRLADESSESNGMDLVFRTSPNTIGFETTDNATSKFAVNYNGQVTITDNLDVGAGLDVTGNITATGTLACGDITSSDGNGNLTLKDNNHTGSNCEHLINFTASDNTSLMNIGTPFGSNNLFFKYGNIELVSIGNGGQVDFAGNVDCNAGLDVTGASTLTRSTDNATTAIITNNGTTGGHCLKLTSGGTGAGTSIFSVFRNNQSSEAEVFKIDGAGDITATGTLTATAFSGSVSNISGAIANDANNRVLVSDGDGTITAEIDLNYTPNRLTTRHTASGTTYPLFLQNRTNADSRVGIQMIATGSDISDGQFASIEARGPQTGNTRHMLYFKTCVSGGTPTDRFYIDSDGHVLPAANNNYDLGASGSRWRNVYTNDLNLSNEGGSNDVDGTWGSYTIQEGAEDLFLVNKRSGKKYKFNLTEVS